MHRSINGYNYDFDNIMDVHENAPGHWEGRTVDGAPFFILGGTRAHGSKNEWYAMAPKPFKTPAPQRVKSLAEGLRVVDEAAQHEPEVRKARERMTPRRKPAPAKAKAEDKADA